MFVHGDLSQLPQRRGKPYVNMRQRCKTQTSDGGTHGDLFGQAVFIEPNKTGGSARFPGLAIDPEAEDQVIEVYFEKQKKIVPIKDWGETVVEFDLTPAKPQAGVERTSEPNNENREDSEPGVFKVESPVSKLKMKLLDPQLLQTVYRIKVVEGFDKDILSVTAVSPNRIRVQANKVGVTTLALIDEDFSVMVVEVIVESDVVTENKPSNLELIENGLTSDPKMAAKDSIREVPCAC